MLKRFILLGLVVLSGSYAIAQLDRSVPPQPGPAPLINIGEYETFELRNGLRVIVVQDRDLPIVSYNLHVEVDPVLEGNAAGFVSLAGSLLRSGTATRSKAEIDNAVDFIGATLQTSSTGVFARSLTRHSENLLEVMADVVMNPTFPREELDKSILQWNSALQAEKGNPNAIASNIAAVLRNGKGHPYGEVVTEQTLENVTVEMLRDFHHTYFRPNVSYLVIVGDISTRRARSQARRYFGGWEKAEVPTRLYPVPPLPDRPVVAIANREGANQSLILVTHPVILPVGHPDAIKASVMNQVLGGGSFNARLFQNLRERHGFTYGAFSRLQNDPVVGHFLATSSVRTSVTDSALHQVLHEMRRLQTELVSKEDLQLVINMMMGDFSLALEDPRTIARFALNIERFGLPANYYKNYLEKVAAVTPGDVKQMANKYLHPSNAYIIAVGEAYEIEEVMRQFSPDGTVKWFNYHGEKVK